MKQPSGKVYTRRGDQGKTRLLSGEIVSKDDLRPKTYGAVDELQSHLGLARSLTAQSDVRSILYDTQKDLFIAGAELACSSEALPKLKKRIEKEDTAKLERWIDDCTGRCGLPGDFLIPGNTVDSAAVHVARATCRRCERLVVMLNRENGQYEALIGYLNRLSDLLFVLAWLLEFYVAVDETVRRLNSERGGESRRI